MKFSSPASRKWLFYLFSLQVRFYRGTFLNSSLKNFTKLAAEKIMVDLDLGCGLNKQKNHLGIDIRKHGVADIIADLENLPIKNSCVHKIYSRRAIQHVENYNIAFKEIFRILKPGCEFKIIVASFWGLLFYKIGLSQSRGRYSVFHLFTKTILNKQLKQQNFVNIQIHKIRSKRKIGYDFQVTAKKTTL